MGILSRRPRPARSAATAALLVLLLAGCASWKPLREYEGWTLYVEEEEHIEVARYETALSAAFDAVETIFGPFEDHVRVHAWQGGVRMESGARGSIHRGEEPVHEVPGIGPARVQGFHARGGNRLFQPSGVFVGSADTGTATHELVHARLAEIAPGLPLWLEEGMAGFLGDGTTHQGRWVVDGLACWPLRELRNQPIDDDALRRLLAQTASREHSLRDNVLIHFVGWALVFDLYREEGRFDWPAWVARYQDGMALGEARERLARTLDTDTPRRWLVRLGSEDPGVRMAAAKGIWKLRDTVAVSLLYEALRVEEDPEIRAGLAINGVACVGEMRLPWPLRRRLSRSISVALRDPGLEDPLELQAIRTVYVAWRSGLQDAATEEALEALRRFWAE